MTIQVPDYKTWEEWPQWAKGMHQLIERSPEGSAASDALKPWVNEVFSAMEENRVPVGHKEMLRRIEGRKR